MKAEGSRGIFVGGASGMCRATATEFARRGGKVAILDREQSDGAAVAQELGGKFYQCNVALYDEMGQVIDQAVEGMGGLEFCVNTAGGGVQTRTLGRNGEMHSIEDFEGVIKLNLVATFNINRHAARHMSRNEPNEDGERGVLINTSSIAAFEGQIGQVAYTASKAGVSGMTLTMARDLGVLGIRVMAIAPSLFSTGMTARVTEEFALNLVRDAAFPKRMGKPEEFATMALAIFECPMMNGSTLRVDAGQRFGPK